jgi:hypothetical protein
MGIIFNLAHQSLPQRRMTANHPDSADPGAFGKVGFGAETV